MPATTLTNRTVLDLVKSHSAAADVLAGVGVQPSHLEWTLEAAMRDLAVNVVSVERELERVIPAGAADRPLVAA